MAEPASPRLKFQFEPLTSRHDRAAFSCGTAALDFTLAATAIELEQVVTTATGEQRKNEVGNDIPRLNAPQTVETKPVPPDDDKDKS